MKFINKKHTLVFIIILLLITNFVLSALFIFKNPHPDRKNPDREKGRMYVTLQKEVGFSEEQLKEYQALRKEQFKNLKPLFNGVRNSKETFYEFLYDPNISDSLIRNGADSIGYHQKMLDLQMLSYFKKIRKTCTEDQLPKFDSSMRKFLQRMTGKPEKNDPK